MTVVQDNVLDLPTKLDLTDAFAIPAPENAALPAGAEITLSMKPAHIQPEQIRCGSLGSRCRPTTKATYIG